MMQVVNDTIQEVQTAMTVTYGGTATNTGGYVPTGTTGYWNDYTYVYPPSTYWHSYPVYVCTDKTKKAIDVLKALEADGLKVASVPKFIKLVEKIAGLL